MIPRDLLFNRLPRAFILASSQRYLARSSQRPKPPAKHYRLWAVPGDFVRASEILAKQYTIKWHPGLNAGIDNNRMIYSLCDGVMIITEEKFNPDWEHELVAQVYKDPDGNEVAPEYKRYIHVIPKRRISEFKLVDLV